MSTAPTKPLDSPIKDHIFISYATEDGALAEWLSLKLTAEGYKVWCDRTHLLGGESYPKDIDFAIKNLTFRVLGLLSRNSISKDNPRKERTLAINLGKERKEDFLIPINVDGLLPTELDWMTSDLTFIPFQHNRADGLARLVRKLDSIGAPKQKEQGQGWVTDWFAGRDNPATRTEQLWTNVIPILEVPKHLFQYEVAGEQPLGALRDMWAFYPKTDNVVWAFGTPPQGLAIAKRTDVLEWQSPEYEKTSVRNIVSYLFKRSMLLHCLRKGMRFTAEWVSPSRP